MQKMLNITATTNQKTTFTLPDGSLFSITLYFSDRQIGWFIKELTYNTFTLKGIRVTNSPNIMHQFSNKLPFGIACLSTNNLEPFLVDSFTSGVSTLYLLTATEVASYGVYVTT